jgi:hypothetical protein
MKIQIVIPAMEVNQERGRLALTVAQETAEHKKASLQVVTSKKSRVPKLRIK